MKIPVVILMLTSIFLLTAGCMTPVAPVTPVGPDDQFRQAWQESEVRIVNYATEVTNSTDLQVMAKLSEDMMKDIDNTTDEISRINVSMNYTPIKQEYLSALDYLRLTCIDIISASHAKTDDEAQEFIISATGNLKDANVHRVWVQQKMSS
jgi:hypothetical protein